MYFLHTISLKCLYINQGDLGMSIPLKSGKKYPLVWPCRVVYDTNAFGLWSELIKYNIFSMQVWQLEWTGTVNQITKDYQCPAQIISSLKLSPLIFTNQDNLPLCTSSGLILHCVSLISVHSFRRNCPHEKYGQTDRVVSTYPKKLCLQGYKYII